MIAMLNFFYNHYFQIVISTPLDSPIVLSQAPYPIFYFLFMARVPFSEGLCWLAYILALALLAGAKVDNVWTLAIYFLSDLIRFLCVRASKSYPFLQNFTCMAFLFTFSASRIYFWFSPPTLRRPWFILINYFRLLCLANLVRLIKMS